MTGRHAKADISRGQYDGWLALADVDHIEVGERQRVRYQIHLGGDGFVMDMADVEVKVPKGRPVAWSHVYDDRLPDVPIAVLPIRPPAKAHDVVTFRGTGIR